jgi:hypothetical protein
MQANPVRKCSKMPFSGKAAVMVFVAAGENNFSQQSGGGARRSLALPGEFCTSGRNGCGRQQLPAEDRINEGQHGTGCCGLSGTRIMLQKLINFRRRLSCARPD